MPPPDPTPGSGQRLAARLGFFAATFIVFASGWVAVRAKEWRTIAISALAALVAAWLASTFRRWGR